MKNGQYIKKILIIAMSAVMLVGSGTAITFTGIETLAANTTSTSVQSLTNNSSVNSLNLTKGQYLTLNAKASGGKGGYTYAFYYKKTIDKKWVTAKGFSSTSTVKIKPAMISDYEICIKVKDSENSVSAKYFNVKVSPVPTLKALVSSDVVTLGQTVTLKASATGGKGSYQYAYYYKKKLDKNWYTAKEFSENSSAVIKPSVATDYEICIKAKDSNEYVVKEYFDIKVLPTVLNKSTISKNYIPQGESVSLKALGSGGTGKYTYAFYAKPKNSDKWSVLKSFSTQSSVQYGPSEKGSYDICIKVMDSNGFIAKSYYSLTVGEKTVENKIDDILSEIITENMSEFAKAKAIHDWIAENIEYDQSIFQTGNIPESDYTIEGVLLTKKAVCDGYAKLFLQMSRQSGLEAERITGYGTNTSGQTESHAWNQVRVEGEWYNVDVTWDDPIIYGITDNSNIQYDYFLVPDSIINKDHTSVKNYNSDFTQHTCTAIQPMNRIISIELAKDVQQNNYYYAENISELKKIMSDNSSKGIYSFSVIYHSTSNIQNDLRTCLPSGYGTNYSYRSWRFSGYTLINVTLV